MKILYYSMYIAAGLLSFGGFAWFLGMVLDLFFIAGAEDEDQRQFREKEFEEMSYLASVSAVSAALFFLGASLLNYYHLH